MPTQSKPLKEAEAPAQHIENVKIVTSAIIQQLCRLCLEEKQTMWSFFSLLTFEDGSTIDVSNVFHILTGGDKLHMENPELPSYICEQCLDLLSSAYKFQQKYEESMKILNDYLAKKENAEDTVGEIKGRRSDQYLFNKGKKGTEYFQNTDKSSIHTFQFTSTKDSNIIQTINAKKTNEFPITQETITLAVIEDPPASSEIDKTQAKLHRCPICPKLCTALELKKHCSTHQTLKSYLKSAPRYNKKVKFYARPRTENRGLFNQKNIIHSCPFCQEEFESEPFKDHIKQHRLEGNFRCNICNRIFLGINHLKTHQLSHKKEAPFKCKFCKKVFFLKRNFDFHLLKHSNNTVLPFKCEYCSKTFSNPEHLKRHRFIHENNVPYHTFYKREMIYVKCKQCQQKFKNEEDKAVHVCKVFCAKCHKLFESKNKFKLHICKNKLKVSHCLPCGKVFQLPSSYKTHKFRCKIRTLCYVCGKNVTNISQHLLTHYPNKKAKTIFKCAECDKQFNHKSNLIRHISEVHSNIVRFQCQYCSKGFKGKWNLQVHERIHHGIRTHVCNICNKGFLEKSYLKKHLKVHLRREGLIHVSDNK